MSWSWVASRHSPFFIQKLQEELESWEGTPYAEGQQCKGAGADCVRFACAIMDVIFGQKNDPRTLPHDAAWHSRASSVAALKQIMSLYRNVETVQGNELEPGDIVVTGPRNGGPGHAMIVGGRPNELWHCSGKQVHRTSIQLLDTPEFMVFRVFRMVPNG